MLKLSFPERTPTTWTFANYSMSKGPLSNKLFAFLFAMITSSIYIQYRNRIGFTFGHRKFVQESMAVVNYFLL